MWLRNLVRQKDECSRLGSFNDHSVSFYDENKTREVCTLRVGDGNNTVRERRSETT